MRLRAINVPLRQASKGHSRPLVAAKLAENQAQTPMSSNSSQADSAGSIPVTRSTREYCCSRTECEASSSCETRGFQSTAGPLWATHFHHGAHPSVSEGRSACPVVFSGSPVLPTSPKLCLRHNYELDVNGLNSTPRRNSTSDPRHAPACQTLRCPSG